MPLVQTADTQEERSQSNSTYIFLQHESTKCTRPMPIPQQNAECLSSHVQRMALMLLVHRQGFPVLVHYTSAREHAANRQTQNQIHSIE